MALAFRSIFTNHNPTFPQIPFPSTQFPKTLNSPFSPHFPNHIFLTPKSQIPPFKKVSASFDDRYSQIDGNTSSSSTSSVLNFDCFLSICEFSSLASSAAISLYAAISYGAQKGAVSGWIGSRIFVLQCVILVANVVVGAVIRRRQWRRVCGQGTASYGDSLLRRVEKLEEDLRSSATLIRLLSKQLHKLGIRVRATRKPHKETISEAAALVRNNSEAARALAAQHENLEKELGEIQKVLLAMQEQQQKQLELILAIGKARNLFNTQHVRTKDQNTPQASDSSENGEEKQIETLNVANPASND